MVTTTSRMTVDEFLARDWPRGTQLIAGEVVVSQPSVSHQELVGRVWFELRSWTEAGPGRGYVGLPVEVRLGEQHLFAPDVWWVREERRPTFAERRWHEAPDLVVEVRSPATWRYDVDVKREVYERAGAAEVWLVDTAAASVLVCRRPAATPAPRSEARAAADPGFDVALGLAGEEALTSPLLPGFSVTVAELFAGLGEG